MMNANEIRQTVDTIKTVAGCAMCGYNAHPAALHFDHINPALKYRTKSGKIVHLADMVKGGRYSIKTIMAEIAKCRVLCANCHMVYTHSVQRSK